MLGWQAVLMNLQSGILVLNASLGKLEKDTIQPTDSICALSRKKAKIKRRLVQCVQKAFCFFC